MPQVPIIMPQLGESIAEATIVDIKVKPGDEVADDQEILDVETNKAVMGVTTPCKGKIDKITVQLKETYPVGTVLGYVEASEEDADRFKKTVPEPPKGTVAMEIPGREEQATVAARQRDGEGARRIGGLPVPATAKGAGFLSPRVRARMTELQLINADLAGIPPTGAGNRITIKDLENFLYKIEDQTAQEASAIRAGVADAMRRSWTRPLSTIGSSVNLDPVLQDRQPRDPIELHRRRDRRGSGGWNHGAGDSRCRQNVTCRSHDKIQGACRSCAATADFARHASRWHRHSLKLRYVRDGMGHPDSSARSNIAARSRRWEKSSLVG